AWGGVGEGGARGRGLGVGGGGGGGGGAAGAGAAAADQADLEDVAALAVGERDRQRAGGDRGRFEELATRRARGAGGMGPGHGRELRGDGSSWWDGRQIVYGAAGRFALPDRGGAWYP